MDILGLRSGPYVEPDRLKMPARNCIDANEDFTELEKCTPQKRQRNDFLHDSTTEEPKKRRARISRISNKIEKKSPEFSSIRPQGGLIRPNIGDIATAIVNLDRRPDRLAECAKKLQKHCPALQWTRFSATDGKVTHIPTSDVVYDWNTRENCVYQRKRSVRKGWNDLDSYRDLDLTLSPGERGCASSHIRAWRRCLELSSAPGCFGRPLLVLEDDAAPIEDFTPVLERALKDLPEDSDVLYLGYSQAGDWRREVSPDLVEAEYVWTTVAYIVWPAGAKKMLNNLPVNQPVDNWMAGLTAAGKITSYCTRPKIVGQAEPWNVNSDVGHSDEFYWGTDSDIRHSDDFYWGTYPHGLSLAADDVADRMAPQNALADQVAAEASLPRVGNSIVGGIAGGSLWADASDSDEDAVDLVR